MKTIIKNSFVSWLIFLSTLICGWIVYATITNVSGWQILTASKMNELISVINAWAIAPSWAIIAFNLSSCPSWWIIADGSNSTPDLRWRFIRWLNTGWVNNASWTTLWEYQDDTLQNITWEIYWTYAAIVREWASWVFSKSLKSNWNSTTSPNYATTWKTDRLSFDASDSIWARTSYETRPKNISLLYCVKQ